MRLKPALYLALLIIPIALPIYAQESLEGHWQGALIREGAVQVIFVDFVKEGTGLSVRIETPDLVIAESVAVAFAALPPHSAVSLRLTDTATA